MLTAGLRRRHGGFTIIELLVVISVVAILSLTAVPSIGNWISNASVRNVAESLQNDLRRAQAEAVRGSRSTVFALTTAVPAYNATPAANGTNWYVRNQPLAGSDETATSESLVTSSREATRRGVTITGPALTCFGALGQLITVADSATGLSTACNAANPITYTVAHTSANRALNVLVYVGGRVFMCDAAKTQSSTNPDGCPT